MSARILKAAPSKTPEDVIWEIGVRLDSFSNLREIAYLFIVFFSSDFST